MHRIAHRWFSYTHPWSDGSHVQRALAGTLVLVDLVLTGSGATGDSLVRVTLVGALTALSCAFRNNTADSGGPSHHSVTAWGYGYVRH